MSIIVKEVTTNKELKAFINLPYRLYKDHPYYVPPLSFDEMGTLRKDKNPAFDYCEAKYFLAYKEGREYLMLLFLREKYRMTVLYHTLRDLRIILG